MSTEPDFDQIYRLLGVQPDQGWEAVRRAYRQRVQALHPDKADGDPNVLRQARQRFEQLNAGYRELRRYRDIFESLPPTGLAAASIPKEANREWPAAAPTKPRRSKLVVGFMGLSLAGAIAWFALERESATVVWRTDDKAGLPAAAMVPAPRITVGASLGDVLDIQGQPDRVDGDVWHYGNSTIVFESGRVASWEAASTRALRTATLNPPSDAPARPEAPIREFFQVGATKAEVARIQGQPLNAGESEWDYGVSKVYFENDRVVSWYNSPVDPLKVPGPYHHD